VINFIADSSCMTGLQDPERSIGKCKRSPLKKANIPHSGHLKEVVKIMLPGKYVDTHQRLVRPAVLRKRVVVKIRLEGYDSE
jgi:hypothetical protein